MLLSRGDAIGGFVRIAGAKTAGALPAEARDFGAVHLDRTFEQNRVLFARDRTGSVVDMDCRTSPGAVRLPLAVPTPDLARLEREKDLNLTSALTLEWPAEQSATAADAAGRAAAGRLRQSRASTAPQDAGGDCLALVWEDARTRLTLRLPYESNTVVFRAENRPGAETATPSTRPRPLTWPSATPG